MYSTHIVFFSSTTFKFQQQKTRQNLQRWTTKHTQHPRSSSPGSPSPIHSVQLQENQVPVSLVTTRVLEPYNITDKGGNQTNLAITHSQSQDDEKFSFGSSGTSNGFTFKHHESSGEKDCYFNISPFQLWVYIISPHLIFRPNHLLPARHLASSLAKI